MTGERPTMIDPEDVIGEHPYCSVTCERFGCLPVPPRVSDGENHD